MLFTPENARLASVDRRQTANISAEWGAAEIFLLPSRTLGKESSGSEGDPRVRRIGSGKDALGVECQEQLRPELEPNSRRLHPM